MKKLLLFLVMCLLAFGFIAKADVFSTFSVKPASGSTVSYGEFHNFSITFPDCKKIKVEDSAHYKIYTKEEGEKLDQYGLHCGETIDKTWGTWFDKTAKIDGNTVSFTITTPIKEEGDYILVISQFSFIDGNGEENEVELEMAYHITVPELSYVVTPSNAEPIEAVKIRDFSIEFPDASELTLLRSFWPDEGAKMDVLSEDGEVLLETKARENAEDDKYWKTEGNKVSIRIPYTLEKFKKSGTYYVVFCKGSFNVDGLVQDEIRIAYQLTVEEPDPDKTIAIESTNKLDEKNQLVVSWENGNVTDVSENGAYGTKVYDKEEQEVGYLWSFVIFPSEQRVVTGVMFSEEPDEAATYHFTLAKGAFLFRDVYLNDIDSAPLTVHFSKTGETGIEAISIDGDAVACYDLFGRKAGKHLKTGHFIIRKGQKTYVIEHQ